MLMQRIVFVVIAVAMTSTGIVFCAIALFNALLTSVSAAGAAAFTALTFFALLAIGALVRQLLARPDANPVSVLSPTPQMRSGVVTALAVIAHEYPLIAVGCGAAMGLADAMNGKPR
ncbi:MAG: hypothetical protein ABL973_09865 [Micropepsaceae bacterium]